MARQHGVLCFSLDRGNPLLWSHYADKHRGLALGFDVDEGISRPIIYRSTRPALGTKADQIANALLFTKYEDWRYEQEIRIYTNLNERDPASNLYFGDFGEQLVLREVIAGPLCPVTEKQLSDAVGSTTGVRLTKARLAFNTFRVVTDQRGFRTE